MASGLLTSLPLATDSFLSKGGRGRFTSRPKRGSRNSTILLQLPKDVAARASLGGATHDQVDYGGAGARPYGRFCIGSAERWKCRKSEQRRRWQHKLSWRRRIGPLTVRMEKAAQRSIRLGLIFPFVRSGTAYGGLTSVLAPNPSILFCSLRRMSDKFVLLSVNLSHWRVHDELFGPTADARRSGRAVVARRNGNAITIHHGEHDGRVRSS